MTFTTLSKNLLDTVAKQNSNVRDLAVRFKYLPAYGYLKTESIGRDPHKSALEYAQTKGLRLCVGYAVHKTSAAKTWTLETHSFVLSESSKVIETTKGFPGEIVHYLGVVVPKENYRDYLDKFSRLDFIKKLSPMTTFVQ